jgi:hypothetical protein
VSGQALKEDSWQEMGTHIQANTDRQAQSARGTEHSQIVRSGKGLRNHEIQHPAIGKDTKTWS